MRVRTQNKPTRYNLSPRLCRQALKFFGRQLLTEHLYNQIEIKLIFLDVQRGRMGDCTWMDTNYRPREFEITVRKSLCKKQMLMSLAHEMVHLAQFARGDLMDHMNCETLRWKDDVYNVDMDYWESPWEIEAYGREIGLYVKFRKYLKQRQKRVVKNDSVRRVRRVPSA